MNGSEKWFKKGVESAQVIHQSRRCRKDGYRTIQNEDTELEGGRNGSLFLLGCRKETADDISWKILAKCVDLGGGGAYIQ